MAAVIPGTGGTIKSATLEGQLQEAAMLLQIIESTALSNPTSLDKVTVAHDPDLGVFTASYNFPTEQTINGSGGISYEALEYLTGVDFIPGTSGTFRSTTLTGYLMELAIYAQNIERVPASNPTSRNGVTGTFNSDSTVFTGTLNLPVTVTIEPDGAIKYTATEYLVG